MPVKVKICGVTSAADARAVVESGADALGINFWPGSSRFVRPRDAAAVLAVLPEGFLSVGVFVDAPRATIERLVEDLGLGAVQLHGHEEPEECRGWKVPVIKAFRVAELGDEIQAMVEACPADYVLLDSGAGGRAGGTGETFPWERAVGVAAGRLILAGGLTPENVAAAVRQVQPCAVDVAGGVEVAPGRKDAGKIREFVHHVQHA
jgi:phosphoribosylanthranilate isomerase